MYAVPMSFHYVFRDGEPKAAAGSIPAASFLGTVKTFKNPQQVFFRNADAVITQFYQDITAIGIIHAGHDGAAILPVLDGIVNQVGEYLPDLFLVGKNRQRLFTSFFYGKADVLLLCIE